MLTIGTFTKHGNNYTGEIRTIGLAIVAEVRAVDAATPKAPNFRVYADTVEVGAGWLRYNKTGGAFISIRMDDPCLPAPLNAMLIERDGQHLMVWERKEPKAAE